MVFVELCDYGGMGVVDVMGDVGLFKGGCDGLDFIVGVCEFFGDVFYY